MGKFTKKSLAVLLAVVLCFSLLPLGALADGMYDTAFLYYDDNVDYEEIAVPESQSITDEDGDGNNTFTVSTEIPVRDEYEFLGWSTNQWDYTPNVGETVDVQSGETLTLYAVWGEKTAKALIYDANLPYRLQNEAYYGSNTYFKYESAYYGDGLEYNFVPNDWTLVYHLPGDTGYVPVSQGQDGKYISLHDKDYDIQYYTTAFSYQASYGMYYYEYDLGLTYYPDSGAPYELSNMPSSQVYDSYGAATINVTDQVPTLSGYTFMGWSEYPCDYEYINESDYAQSSYTLEPNHSRVLYAVWKPNGMDYVSAKPLIYDANVPSELLTATAADSPVYYYHYGEYKYPYYPTPTVLNYSGESDEKPYDWALVYRVDYDTTFVPVYQGQDNKYVPLSGVEDDIATNPYYSFCYANHGYDVYVLPAGVTLANMPLPNAANIKEDMASETEIAVTNTVPTLTGYTFLGWSEDPGDDNTVNAKSSYKIAPNSGVVLYAVWAQGVPETTSTLKYDDNVADEVISVPADQTLTDGNDPKTFTVSTDKPEREGYAFLGWSNTAGENNSADVGATVNVAAGETKTLYAVWQAKQAIKVIAATQEEIYSGEKLTNGGYTVEGTLIGDDVCHATVTGEITDVGSVPNVISDVYVTRDGKDVSYLYTITTEDGTLTIDPRQLTISTPSAEKQYDGKPFPGGPNGPFNALVEGLVEGETIGIYFLGMQFFDVGEYPNEISISFAPEEMYLRSRSGGIALGGETPTAKAGNYTIVSLSIGTLKITSWDVPAQSITITAASGEKVYDGAPLTNDGFTVDGLPAGYTAEATVEGSQTVVGSSENKVTGYVIKNAYGHVETGSFTVKTVPGTLTVKPAPLTITADSDSKLYDGTPLTKDSYTSTALAEGDTISSVTVTGSQTEVGSSANVPSEAKIINAGGEDVTACYDITYVNGTLNVTDSIEELEDPDTPLHGDEEETIDIEPDEDLYTGNIPLTGDESNIAFWAVIAALAVAGIVTMLAGRKRARSSR